MDSLKDKTVLGLSTKFLTHLNERKRQNVKKYFNKILYERITKSLKLYLTQTFELRDTFIMYTIL